MAKLSKSPTVDEFANEWTQVFAQVVREAADPTGQLSVDAACRIRERNDYSSLWATNAMNYLTMTGRDEVSVEKLIEDGYWYARAEAEEVAGPDGRISQSGAENLADDLHDEFFHLRGLRVPMRKPRRIEIMRNAVSYDTVNAVMATPANNIDTLPSRAKRGVQQAIREIENRGFGDDIRAAVEDIHEVYKSGWDRSVIGYVVRGSVSSDDGWEQILIGVSNTGERLFADDEMF